jgi:ABC-2 type transport system ATP-binding protein
VQSGEISILGLDVARDATAVRRQIGVVFQAPSLDKKLTVAENLHHQGRLYGLPSADLKTRASELLAKVGLLERARDVVETLSGGMRRRAEIAKCMLHRPRLLLLDEPSTGLDPGARMICGNTCATARPRTSDCRPHHASLRRPIAPTGSQSCIRANWPPQRTLRAVGGDASRSNRTPADLAAAIADRFGCAAAQLDGAVRLEQPNGHEWIPRLVEAFPGDIQTITLGKPTLEDVFIDRGHASCAGRAEDECQVPARRKKCLKMATLHYTRLLSAGNFAAPHRGHENWALMANEFGLNFLTSIRQPFTRRRF